MKLLPIEGLNLFSNPGVSASVILGTAGSIYFILQSVKLVSTRNRSSKLNQKSIAAKSCVICQKKLENLVEFVTCKGCNGLVCQNQKCSEFILELETWECVNCKKNRVIQQKTGEFFLRHLSELEDQSLVTLIKDVINNWNDGHNIAVVITRPQLNTISKFVEQILVQRIESALTLESSNDHQLLSQTAASTTTSNDYYTDLRRFITHVCEEVMKVTNALDISGIPPRPQREQETLAPATQALTEQQQDNINFSMAIADKKVEVQSTASQATTSYKLDQNQNHIVVLECKEVQTEEAEKCIQKDFNNLHTKSTKLDRLNSKFDDDIQHLNNYIQDHSIALPELSSDSDLLMDNDDEREESEREFDTKLADNWQLREIMRNNIHGIAMLIPSPTQEIRAQIGDRSADEYDSDLSENEVEYESEDEEEEELPQNICYSTTLHIMTKSPLATTKTVPLDNNNEELSSFTSVIDIVSPSSEMKSDKIETENEFAAVSPLDIVSADDNVADEELFDSIVEISSINEHKNSIDEAFESILKAEEKISKDILDTTEAVRKEEEAARRNQKALETLLREEEEVTQRIHEAVNATSLFGDEKLLPVGRIHEAINGTDDSSITYRMVEIDTDDRTRYSSPLFQNYKLDPIKPLKITEISPKTLPPHTAPITTSIFDPFGCHNYSNHTSAHTIPHDESINNLLHTASLISRSRTDLSSGDDESVNFNKDPERVLMRNVVPGSFAEREHKKWLHAAPIANNPYSPDVLERRLSETHSKQKVIDIQALLQQHEPPLIEDKSDGVVNIQPRPNIIKYKRDYYINDDDLSQLLPSPPTTTPTNTPVKEALPTTFEENNEDKIIVPSKKKTYEEMTVSMLIEDVEVPAKYTRHDQDFSLTISEDSETMRIYTPSTQEMKLIAPHAERISTTKGIPVAVVAIDESEIVKIDDGTAISDGIFHEDVYEERQVIEPEVLEHLPSVRKLAEFYKRDSVSPEANGHVDNHIKPKIEKSYSSKSLQLNYPAPIASITARTLPAQVRADLQQRFSAEEQDSHIRSTDREPDPKIMPGFTRNSIAFFENLSR